MSANGEKPVLRDLQRLLQKSIDKDIKVIDYQTSMLLPKGENYGSIMLKVDAVVKKTEDSSKEDLHLVAKMMPANQYKKKFFDAEASFNKEIFVIDTLGKWYRQLEREAGVKEEDLIDIFPKFYGGRLNNTEDPNGATDDDAVMLLENLKVRGYETMDRFHGMDFDHMSLTMKEYARFHALGTALKIKKPDLWEACRKPINTIAVDMTDEHFDDVSKHIIELLCSDPRTNKYSDRIKQAFLTCKGFKTFAKVEEIEPWISIVHGDGWVNNLLYHHAENGKVDDVKIVDYQVARMCSPLKDLPYFLCSSGNIDVIDNHFEELLDIYYDKFIQVLTKTGCDVSPFTKESFQDQLVRDARNELFHCIFVLRIITLQIPQDMDMSDVKSSVMMSNQDPNQAFTDRAWKVVSKFVEKGWI